MGCFGDFYEDLPIWLAKSIEQFDQDSFADGDLLSHDWVRWALDIPTPTTLEEADAIQWVMLARVDAFRDWLLVNRQIALQSIRGQGFRVIPPNEQAQIAADEAMRLVSKGLIKGDRLMTHTRFTELSSDENKRHTDAHVRLSGIRGLMRRQKRDLLRLFSPK